RDDLAVGVPGCGVRNEVDRAAGGRPARGAGEQYNNAQSNPNRSHSDSLSFKFLQGSNGDYAGDPACVKSERRVDRVEPLDRSTSWPYQGGEPGPFYYQRYAHPTGVAAEAALGKLEGGEALLFPSGSGAITALVLGVLEPGQTIAL